MGGGDEGIYIDFYGLPSGLPFSILGFRIGQDMAILGLPHEPFVEYQLFLQKKSPFKHTMVMGYTNGCADYIPTAEAFLAGGYETMLAPKLYGCTSLTLECESIVKETGLQVLQQLAY